MKFTIPIDARLLVNNVEYKGIGTGLFTQLRLASDETTVKSTGTEIETSGVYEFEITGTALTSYLELWICTTENGTYTKVKSWGGTDGIRQKEYLVYSALLNQTGTDAPVATILENTLGVIPTYSYANTGQYGLTSTGLFLAGKTAIVTSWGIASEDSGNLFSLTRDDNDALFISATTGNDRLINTFIEFRIYP